MTNIKKYIWPLLLGIFIFYNVCEETIPILRVFDECMAGLCVPLIIYDFVKTKGKTTSKLARTRHMQFVLLILFLLIGLIGNAIYQYQPLWIALVSSVLAVKFFMILLSAGYIQKYFRIKLEEQELYVEVLSILWFGYYILALIFVDILPQPAAWDVCAKSILLFALLVFCKHSHEWLYRICLLMMSIMLIMCGKEKAYGAILVFVILYYTVVHKKVKTEIKYILYMAIPVAILAWDKIYVYYIEGQGKYPKSILLSTSLKIAKDYLPIGTGFGTFASTYAANHYSPVYYMYGLSEHEYMNENTRMYLKDVFWPVLLGETGILGTIIYCGLLIILFIQIQRVYYYDKKKYMLMIFMYVYMLITTFSEAGFMQPMVMIYAFVMGILLEEYEGKRKHKLRYFEEKD